MKNLKTFLFLGLITLFSSAAFAQNPHPERTDFIRKNKLIVPITHFTPSKMLTIDKELEEGTQSYLEQIDRNTRSVLQRRKTKYSK